MLSADLRPHTGAPWLQTQGQARCAMGTISRVLTGEGELKSSLAGSEFAGDTGWVLEQVCFSFLFRGCYVVGDMGGPAGIWDGWTGQCARVLRGL